MRWHILDVRAIWVKEFASALSRVVQTVNWLPEISYMAFRGGDEREEFVADPLLPVRIFPLQRGFARFPFRLILPEMKRVLQRIRDMTPDDVGSALVLTSPHYHELAAMWKGPKIYYATDMFRFWGDRKERIERMENRMCRHVDLICPDSQRIADYMKDELHTPSEKIVVSPMGTREASIFPECPKAPSSLPSDVVDLKRPIAGVIGNLAANTDWVLLHQVIRSTPWLSWCFVGSTEMPVFDPNQRQTRERVMNYGKHVRFTGHKSYGELRDYARGFDVAILPYAKREPTYSGSSTRFYEHLAACRPILATHGTAELLNKEPLLSLVGSALEMTQALEDLNGSGFQDGYENMRWQASRQETWEIRAEAMRQALAKRMNTPFLKARSMELPVH